MTDKISMQQAFEMTVTGLYAQGSVSIGETGTCVYRNPIGLKCGIGFLIPDSVYHSGFEHNSASFLLDNRDFEALFLPEVTDDFLDAMQRELHDQFTRPGHSKGMDFKDWLAIKARAFAKSHDLVLPLVITRAEQGAAEAIEKAGPDLLAALTALMPLWERDNVATDYCAEFEAAELAIAKAKGESS